MNPDGSRALSCSGPGPYPSFVTASPRKFLPCAGAGREMSVQVCPSSISLLPKSAFSNETVLSVMTVAYMQNGALTNGIPMVPERPGQKWVVQKFGGESDPLRTTRTLLSTLRNKCGQIPREHSPGRQVSWQDSPNESALIHLTGQGYRHH